MKARQFTTTFLLAAAGLLALAGSSGGFSARTKLHLAKTADARKQPPRGGMPQAVLPVFIHTDGSMSSQELSALGVKVSGTFGNVFTGEVCESDLSRLASNGAVRHISAASPLTLCNDKALSLSMADSVVSLLPERCDVLTGRGVVVGVVDVGVDFNHINFRGSTGENRIKRVYLPCDTTGTAPVIDSMALPGSHYFTAAQIANLATDSHNMSHGTHTIGTAAGGYRGNGFHGVAPGADIVVCAMPDDSLTDVNIANSLRYIFSYADSVGMPAVVNMSLAGYDWTHDGTAMLCRVIDNLAAPGHIVVVSAGNSGEIPCYLTKNIKTTTDPLKTVYSNWLPSRPLSGYSSAWSSSDAAHSLRVSIRDIKQDTICAELMSLSGVADTVVSITSDVDSIFARYFTGALEVATAIEDNNRYHSLLVSSMVPSDNSRYRIGLEYSAPVGETLSLWSGGTAFYSNCSLSGWTYGSTAMTISDLATTDNAISVGAYCSKKTITKQNGGTLNYSRSSPYDIAYFSSAGPDANGKARPDVAAPGFALVSSANRHDTVSSVTAGEMVMTVEEDGESYPYGVIYGTSMSAPVVTGAIALLLQIKPDLTPDRVREILYATAQHDTNTSKNTRKWGAGKLDVQAAINYVTARMTPDVNRDGVLSVADVTAIYNVLLGTDDTFQSTADVNCDGQITIADATAVYQMMLSSQ